MFTKAIVRTPGKSLVNGLTSADLGVPNFELALKQHQDYIDALKGCGVEVIVLPPNENYPDSTFLEDTALLTPHCAVITNPGAPSRKGEIVEIKEVLKEFYIDIEIIKEPGTVEAGDIMMVGSHYYIGLSERTNLDGAEQTITILKNYGMTGSLIEVDKGLHLKSSLAYLEDNILVATREFSNLKEFEKFNIVEIPDEENYAANCIWVNNRVMIPQGYPESKSKILDTGIKIIELDVSEFRKLDGGLSCLSLRF